MAETRPARHCPIGVSKTTIPIRWKQVRRPAVLCFCSNAISTLDYLEPQVSPVQRQGNVTNTCHYESPATKKPPCKPQHQISLLDEPVNDSGASPDSHRSTNSQSSQSQTSELRFLPEDFTVDETHGMALDSTGFLTDESFAHVQTIAKKSSLRIDVNDEESRFVRLVVRARNASLEHSTHFST